MAPLVDRHDFRIGFIGLGEMGLPMARRLARQGSLTVFDAGEDVRRRAGEAGLTVAESSADVARVSDVVVVMVPSGYVDAVLFADRGLVEGASRDLVVIEGGNSDPRRSIVYAGRLAETGVTMLDVGFSGGPLGAAEGTLSVMVGGDRTAFERVEPVLGDLGREIAYFGASGNGHLAKALNHLVQGLTAQAIGEALAVAAAYDIPLDDWVRVAGGGAAGSWLMQRAGEMLRHPAVPAEQVDPWWRSLGARNQLSYALEAAESTSTAVPLAATGHQVRVLSLGETRSPAMDYYTRLTWELAHARHQESDPS